MLIALIVLAMVLGVVVGVCVVLWGRMQELDVERDWPNVPMTPAPPAPMMEMVESTPESVKVIQAMGEAMAKVWNPPTSTANFQQPDNEDIPEPEPDYDPWAEHEREMLEAFTVDLTSTPDIPVGEPPDEME